MALHPALSYSLQALHKPACKRMPTALCTASRSLSSSLSSCFGNCVHSRISHQSEGASEGAFDSILILDRQVRTGRRFGGSVTNRRGDCFGVVAILFVQGSKRFNHKRGSQVQLRTGNAAGPLPFCIAEPIKHKRHKNHTFL